MPEGIDALTDIEGVLLHRLVHASGGGEWGAELLMRRGAETARRGVVWDLWLRLLCLLSYGLNGLNSNRNQIHTRTFGLNKSCFLPNFKWIMCIFFLGQIMCILHVGYLLLL